MEKYDHSGLAVKGFRRFFASLQRKARKNEAKRV